MGSNKYRLTRNMTVQSSNCTVTICMVIMEILPENHQLIKIMLKIILFACFPKYVINTSIHILPKTCFQCEGVCASP